MKTVVFYSYKGGQGRTTALTNVASCLYRLNKNVVMLDMDVECPGLPPKFGISAFAENDIVALKGGIVDYLVDAIPDRFSSSELQKRVIGTELLMNGADPDNTGETSAGSLSLIATGRVSSNYFQNLQNPVWNILNARGKSSSTGTTLSSFDKLLLAIQGLQPTPDYLLVDLSSGLTRLGTSLLTAWAAPTLLFFSLDQESLDGTSHMLNHLEANSDRRADMGRPGEEIAVYPVLSRISAFIPQDELDGLRARAAMALFNKSDRNAIEKIALTCSDPELEKESKLRIPLCGRVSNVRLVHDYSSLVARVFPECTGAASPATADALIEHLRISKRTEEQHKIFVVPNSQGVMINMSDGQRNVSFKVNTFLSMIDDIHIGLLADSADTTPTPRAIEDGRADTEELRREDATDVTRMLEGNLYEAGLLGGARFGKSLMEEVWKDRKPESLQARVEEWCNFDSAVGFGLLSCPEIQMEEGVIRGQIHIHDNFLTSTRKSNQRGLCPLLSGYIAGVLKAIIGDKSIEETGGLFVRHEYNQCMQFRRDLDHCIFTFITEQNAHPDVQPGEVIK